MKQVWILTEDDKVWILTKEDPFRGGRILGVYATREAGLAEFLSAAESIGASTTSHVEHADGSIYASNFGYSASLAVHEVKEASK